MRIAASVAFTVIALGCDSEPTNPFASTPAVIAHRGASDLAPEHTIAAYDRAVADGADYIELDIARTADSVLVVLHDATLDRTARGPAASCTGPVGQKTLAQIRECDAGAWFNATFPDRARSEYAGLRIPTVAEVLTRYRGQAGFYIEIKDPDLYPGIEADLIRLLETQAPPIVVIGLPQVFVQSFSATSLRRIRALDPFIATIQLFSTEFPEQVQAALPEIREYATGIAPHSANTTAALVDAAHEHCIFVHPYTAETPFEISRLLEMDVDGIITDRPDVMRSLVAGPASPGFRVCPAP